MSHCFPRFDAPTPASARIARAYRVILRDTRLYLHILSALDYKHVEQLLFSMNTNNLFCRLLCHCMRESPKGWWIDAGRCLDMHAKPWFSLLPEPSVWLSTAGGPVIIGSDIGGLSVSPIMGVGPCAVCGRHTHRVSKIDSAFCS
jgi:hypothetical protein